MLYPKTESDGHRQKQVPIPEPCSSCLIDSDLIDLALEAEKVGCYLAGGLGQHTLLSLHFPIYTVRTVFRPDTTYVST